MRVDYTEAANEQSIHFDEKFTRNPVVYFRSVGTNFFASFAEALELIRSNAYMGQISFDEICPPPIPV